MKPRSIPLLVLAVAWLGGIASAAATSAGNSAALAAAGLLGAVVIIASPRPSTLLLVVVGITLIFVARWQYERTVPQPGSIARFNDGADVRLQAVIDDEPTERSTSRLYRLDVRQVFVDGRWQSESGGILLRASLFSEYEYGDLVEVSGRLETPPVLDGFDYRDYLLQRGIVSESEYPEMKLISAGHGSAIQATLISLRNGLSETLNNVLPEPESSLAGGILLGARSTLPDDLKAGMNTTGTSHMVTRDSLRNILLDGLTP